MEAIGRLAGGVAHDFNNILLAITGYTSLALNQSESAGIREHLERVMEAADRAAGITSRLLSFARRKRLEETSVQLEAAIKESASMLRPLIGERLNLAVSCKSDAGAILVDPVALQQVIVNLVVNARDAITDAGKIELWAERQKSSEAVVLYSGERAPGEWGVISVRDSGTGIDEETLERIFEPFFTTKPMGQGTGLGLATVWWIMNHSNGLIDIQSAPGAGTTISVHFPASYEAATGPKEEDKNSLPSWRILVVEDDPMVRAPLLALLAEEGCEVEAAESGAEAMDFLESNKTKFDCLLCDIILPDANGRDIALAFKAKYPELRTVLMSGYDPDSLDVSDDGLTVISKPFTMEDLRIALEGAG
jgi:CheY-like chemotaxis protein